MKQSILNMYFRRTIQTLIFAMAFVLLQGSSYAQQEEVLLTFRHQAIGNIYVNSLYDSKTDKTFLPVIELFSLFEINYKGNAAARSVSGNFITPDNPYSINLSTLRIQIGKNSFPITPDDFRLGETDFYLAPEIFEKVFGLNFTVNVAQLMLTLETKLKLPIEERLAREHARTNMENKGLYREDFPLGYDRKRAVFSGGMLDYSITGNYAKESQGLGYTFTGGMELLGGDVQGTVYGSNTSSGSTSLSTSGLRWRYALRDNKMLSSITAGQINTTGLQQLSIKGISISNDPIEPRRMYETYVVDGHTEPESEVEIYVNERLSDFKRADELGYYRFNLPITYGTTRISLRIYTPSGELIVTDRQMQVPFTFLPRGVVSYNIQAGKAESFSSDTLQGKWVGHGNVALGVSRWLTASVGSQYLGNKFATNNLTYYGSLAARIAKQYLIGLDAAPQNYYRLTGSVMYFNNLSFNVSYLKFDGTSIFNSRSAKSNTTVNIYIPFKIFGMNTGFRLGGEQYVLANSKQTTYTTDFSARLGKINMRFNYRDNFISSDQETNFGQGMFTTALTYTISRSPGLPVYVRGMYLRAQNMYDIRHNILQTSELELSRTVFKSGRFNVGVSYNHVSQIVSSQVGFTLDLSKVRSATTVNSVGSNVTARQSLYGSIGWDKPNGAVTLNNRQQVGRAAVAAILFIDKNNSGKYDKGDELLPYRGVKLDQTASMEVGRDSILRITQLQSYYKYNLSVNRNSIADATLVPIKDKFSFIADPNQYKQIEIPFYRGGIIEGKVVIDDDGRKTGQGGLRLILKKEGNETTQIIRSFNDGGFYQMDLAPGKYTLEVDPAQVEFLQAITPKKLNFEIKALSEGDYVEGLEIILIPRNKRGIKGIFIF
jgi:hypothetical protein